MRSPQEQLASNSSTSPLASVWAPALLPGSETFIRNQIDALRSWRHTLCGLSKVDSPLVRESDTVLFGSSLTERFWRRAVTIMGHSRRVSRFLATSHPSLVHIHFLSGYADLVSRAATRLGVPVIVTAHGFDVTTPERRTGLRASLARVRVRTILNRASLIIAVSEFIQSKVIELGGNPSKVVVHHIGIPIPPPPPKNVVKVWDVAFVGRFVEKKGVLDLIEALGRLRPELHPRCVFIGAGPLLEPAKKLAQRLGVDAVFLGAQPPEVVRSTLQEASVFAAPSRTAATGDSEGFGMVFLEAAAAGLPVASTLHGGIPEAVLDGETGLLSPEGDVPALAQNLRRLVASPALRAQLGTAGRRRVAQEFDIVKQTALLEEIYDAVSQGDRTTP